MLAQLGMTKLDSKSSRLSLSQACTHIHPSTTVNANAIGCINVNVLARTRITIAHKCNPLCFSLLSSRHGMASRNLPAAADCNIIRTNAKALPDLSGLSCTELATPATHT